MSLYCLLPIAHLVLKSYNFFWPHDQSFIEQAEGQDGILALFPFVRLLLRKYMFSSLHSLCAKHSSKCADASKQCQIFFLILISPGGKTQTP